MLLCSKQPFIIHQSDSMAKDKNNRDEYPKLSENDKRWKQQEEFDSAGVQRQSEEEDKNKNIPIPKSQDKAIDDEKV
jgi:hypothetical protein